MQGNTSLKLTPSDSFLPFIAIKTQLLPFCNLFTHNEHCLTVESPEQAIMAGIA